MVKYLSDNLNHQVSSLYDYDKKVFYWRTITNDGKVAVRYKFPKPWKKVTHQEGKVENIIDIPCEVYKTMIKGEERTSM
ncbi:MAG: hypothetical protein ABF286_04445 [Polaribacter sp.]